MMFASITYCQFPLPPAVHMAAPSSRTRITSDGPSSQTIATFHTGSTQYSSTRSNGECLPPYSLDTELPRYTRVPEVAIALPEPPTVTKYLFWAGFLCPLYWIFGAFTLKYTCYRSAHSTCQESSLEKAEDTQNNFVYRRRETEIKWARRCIWALVIMLCITIALGITVWGALSSKAHDKGAQ